MTGEVGSASSSGRYGVVGHPVAHSLSPQIHAAFALQTGIAMEYVRVPSAVDRFAETIAAFFAAGGRGLNVTLPFKLEAHDACDRRSDRALRAGAVNWLRFDDGVLSGDNTDGVGLVRDLDRLLGASGRTLAGTRILLLGAGGAARGVLGPLLDSAPRAVVVANRDCARAAALVAASAALDLVAARSFDDVGDEPFDVIVNATSASLADRSIPLSRSVFANAALVYDMMYGAAPTRFLVDARRAGAGAVADGLGMLVEQAAESCFLWHGTRPETAQVLRSLRASIATST